MDRAQQTLSNHGGCNPPGTCNQLIDGELCWFCTSTKGCRNTKACKQTGSLLTVEECPVWCKRWHNPKCWKKETAAPAFKSGHFWNQFGKFLEGTSFWEAIILFTRSRLEFLPAFIDNQWSVGFLTPSLSPEKLGKALEHKSISLCDSTVFPGPIL